MYTTLTPWVVDPKCMYVMKDHQNQQHYMQILLLDIHFANLYDWHSDDLTMAKGQP